MAEILRIEQPPPAIRDHINQFYDRNADLYRRIFQQLREVRDNWRLSTREGRIAYLKMSYIHSVLTTQVDYDDATEAFDLIMSGGSFEDGLAITGLTRKADYMRAALVKRWLWEEAVHLLDKGDADAAHRLLIDEGPGGDGSGALGIKTAKVPFTLANLGFIQKMCVDGNVARVLTAEDQPSSVVVSKYEDLCLEIKQAFPRLSDKLAAYELQWVIFDYQRAFRVRTNKKMDARMDEATPNAHETWFRWALADIMSIRRRMDQVTPDEGSVEYWHPDK
jgi:hypothetical protein